MKSPYGDIIDNIEEIVSDDNVQRRCFTFLDMCKTAVYYIKKKPRNIYIYMPRNHKTKSINNLNNIEESTKYKKTTVTQTRV